MKFKINKKSRIPIYVQIIEGVKHQIREGDLLIKDRLPTERELAADFTISRNTVSQAYRELEQEGFIQSRIGNGTFVTRNSIHSAQPHSQILQRHVRHCVEEALALGFELAELETAMHDYIKKRKKMIASVKMVFIECNYEQANYFSHHLDLDPEVSIIPLVLYDLRQKTKKVLSEIRSADIIVTSFYHLSEIQRLVKETKKKIIAISLEPDISTLIRIARLPSTSSLGIVTTSNQFLHEIKLVLKENSLMFSTILESTKSNNDDFEKLLNNSNAIIVSPGRKNEVEKRSGKNTEIIEFMFSPDRTSINNLKVSLNDLEKANNLRKIKS